MKALILAAGLGTRLFPFTQQRPKPLFTISGRPLIDTIIRKLEDFGCKEIMINTHHLHKKIEAFIQTQHYAIPVHTRYEPTILGTGGGIKNSENFFGGNPFLVINSDIITDINLKTVYDFHMGHNHPVTLALCDYPEFNTVSLNKKEFIIGFRKKILKNCSNPIKELAFTGIHIIDPEIFNLIPQNEFSDIIDIYIDMLAENKRIKAFVINRQCFKDIGTPESYRNAAMEDMAKKTFEKKNPDKLNHQIIKTRLQGDGSDRKWYRFYSTEKNLIMADHGIKCSDEISETDSFILIGRHLYSQGIPVPEIYLHDTFSGLVFMEDLGDTNLHTDIIDKDKAGILLSYKRIIDSIIKMNISAGKGFKTAWTHQSPFYDMNLILEKECRYFVVSFLNNYLNMGVDYEDFISEFEFIANKALQYPIIGFMHRDMQSRNIMVKNKTFYFIDFQGGRIGPIQYDLASLLIDPYVNLPCNIQNDLLDYAIQKLTNFINFDENKFRITQKYCSIARNLQILGAFGYLVRVKSKKWFEQYIPPAVKTLQQNLDAAEENNFVMLKSVINY
ncbi:MAG TPA: aminoglycoside phosphotransferase [Desulfobacteraceae bacterium]|nr:aminoglycoside phosphotransferase [Desulfobacteraceae bacterium]